MREPNTLLGKGEVEKDVILIGGEDPPLVKKLCEEIMNFSLIRKNKGFHSFKCISYNTKVQFTMVITGIGPSCTEIAFNELAKLGARVFIRAGTSGALKKDLDLKSVVITKNALRLDGVSDLYIDTKFRAEADNSIINALIEAANMLNIKYKTGATLTSSSFYAVGGRLLEDKVKFDGYSANSLFKPPGFEVLEKALTQKNVLNVDMETATLLVLSRLNEIKSGSVCGISNYIPWKKEEQIKHTEKSLNNALSIAVKAIELINT